jgi:hypothetical protein
MKRKQIYIETKQQAQLKELATREHMTESEIIRRALDEYLLERMTPDLRPEDHPVWSIIGIVSGDDIPVDGAENHDRYIYGGTP